MVVAVKEGCVTQRQYAATTLRSCWGLQLTQWLLLQEQEHRVQELEVFSQVVELSVVSVDLTRTSGVQQRALNIRSTRRLEAGSNRLQSRR